MKKIINIWKRNDMNKICIIGAAFYFLELISASVQVKSAIHQILCGIYGMTATFFVCTLFILVELQKK